MRGCYKVFATFTLAWVLPILWDPRVTEAGKEPAKRKAGKASPSKGTQKGKWVAQAPPQEPLSLSLIAFDLRAGIARVQVKGTSRAPDGRHFTFVDERQRRFVPAAVDCKQEEGQGFLCDLGIARVYQRSNLISISVTARGRTVSVPGDQVQTAWAEARAQTPLPPPGTPDPWLTVKPMPGATEGEGGEE